MATATKKGRSTTSKAKQASKKAAAGAKAAAGKVAKAANGGPTKRELAQQRDLELAPKIKDAREAGASWADIKSNYGVDQPKGQVLLKMASVKPKDRIKAKTDEELAGILAEKRDNDGLSWADLAVRAGITMGRVKVLYEQATGRSAAESRVRKAEAPAKAPAKAKGKAPAKGKAAAIKVPAKGKATPAKAKKRAAKKADPSNQA